jgi:hypothetical protein
VQPVVVLPASGFLFQTLFNPIEFQPVLISDFYLSLVFGLAFRISVHQCDPVAEKGFPLCFSASSVAPFLFLLLLLAWPIANCYAALMRAVEW